MSDGGIFSIFSGKQDGASSPSAPVGPDDIPQASPKELELQAQAELLDRFAGQELADTVDLIMLGPAQAQAAQPGYGFACFAARLLSEVGASRIRSIVAAYDVDVIRLRNTSTFWVRAPYADLSSEDLSCVLAAEAAMNRLLFVHEAFESQVDAQSWTEADFAFVDASIINTFYSLAPDQMKEAASNPLIELAGVTASRGGEWDVRTRFANAVEKLRVPFRLTYRFDCSVKDGLFSIDYSAPLASWMPQRRFDAATQAWQDNSVNASQDAARYALSLGVVLAASAFGSSVGIRRVRIASHPATIEADAAMTLYFDRLDFVGKVAPLMQNGGDAWVQVLLESATTADPAFDAALDAIHVDTINDTRPVPDDVVDALYAETVREIDVLSDIPTDSWDAIHAAEADRNDSPLAAIAVLEGEVARADAAVADLPEGTLPLYCGDAVARFLLSVLDIERGTKFARYSDTGFTAGTMLCDLYVEMGEPQRALQQAEKTIRLAPSTTTGYLDATIALFEMDRHADAIPYLAKALSIATQPRSIGYIYYRMAFAQWHAENREAALACYTLCQHFSPARNEVVEQEMRQLLSEMENPQRLDVGEAFDVLPRMGIPEAPTLQVRHLLARIMIGSVDSGILDAMAPITRVFGSHTNFGDQLFAVGQSLERA